MFATSSCVAGQQEHKSLSDGHDASMHINASGQNFASRQSISAVDLSTPMTTSSVSVRSQSQFTRYNRLFNRIDNRLYRVNGVSESCVLVARLMPRCRPSAGQFLSFCCLSSAIHQTNILYCIVVLYGIVSTLYRRKVYPAIFSASSSGLRSADIFGA